MKKEDIKSIVAGILYLDDPNQIQDDLSLFKVYDLSSIDFIDLSFSLKQASGVEIEPNQLWPFNQMLTNSSYYCQGAWTKEGWTRVSQILELSENSEKMTINQIYDYFTVHYIESFFRKLTCAA